MSAVTRSVAGPTSTLGRHRSPWHTTSPCALGRGGPAAQPRSVPGSAWATFAGVPRGGTRRRHGPQPRSPARGASSAPGSGRRGTGPWPGRAGARTAVSTEGHARWRASASRVLAGTPGAAWVTRQAPASFSRHSSTRAVGISVRVSQTERSRSAASSATRSVETSFAYRCAPRSRTTDAPDSPPVTGSHSPKSAGSKSARIEQLAGTDPSSRRRRSPPLKDEHRVHHRAGERRLLIHAGIVGHLCATNGLMRTRRSCRCTPGPIQPIDAVLFQRCIGWGPRLLLRRPTVSAQDLLGRRFTFTSSMQTTVTVNGLWLMPRDSRYWPAKSSPSTWAASSASAAESSETSRRYRTVKRVSVGV